MGLLDFTIGQLAKQDNALAERGKSTAAASVSSLPGLTNQTVVTASDGSRMPAYDPSASSSSVGKPVKLQGGAIVTKVGRA